MAATLRCGAVAVALVLTGCTASGGLMAPVPIGGGGQLCYSNSDPVDLAAERVLLDVLTVGVAEVIHATSDCPTQDTAVTSVAARDYVHAAKMDREKADKGDAKAQYALGIDYEYGLGVQQDSSESAKWYRRAADRGYAPAWSSIAEIYAAGRGVPRDYVQADMWYSLAIAAGEGGYTHARDDLEKQMIPVQIAEAKKLAREWKPAGAGATTSEASATSASGAALAAPSSSPRTSPELTPVVAAPPLPTSADVTFSVDLAGNSYEGVAKLENGRITGQLEAFARPINLDASVEGDSLNARLVGGLDPHEGSNGTGCVANGKTTPASGQVTISMVANCTVFDPKVVLHLDLPAASRG